MAQLKLSFLGPPRAEVDGVPIRLRRRRSIALLAYLAVTRERQNRESLAALLWPESGHRAARAALRRDLSELNVALGDGRIDATRTSVGMHAGYWLDVVEFDRLSHQGAGAESLTAAVDLYQDDFLSGFTLADSPKFDEWQFFQGENLRQTFASSLERLVAILAEHAEYEQATSYARRWLALDESNELANHQLIRMYSLAGQQSAALRQYDRFRQNLEDEFGISPSAELTNLVEEIRSGGMRSIAWPSHTPRHSNLPIQTTKFFGRTTELADIKRLLLSEADCRLLSLIGPGGIGKTRLALASAAQMLDKFPDGVHFVPLASVSEGADVVPAIAEVLGLQFYGNVDPKRQLLDHLRTKDLLLVVDNFEHLRGESSLIADILTAAPQVIVLTTSRERLNLQEEWVYDVHGLVFPDQNTEASMEGTEHTAMQLFIQRAGQISARFSPSAEDMTDIARICQLVEGMPLGLELAAPWIRTLSCREIAEEIQHSLDFLTTSLSNVEMRHRSISAVFGQTWERLSGEERDAMQRLSVFRGGCTREAAEKVAGAEPRLLASLIDKALVRRTNTGRYELHELIRQYAEMKLQTERGAYEQTRLRHRSFFVRFLERRTAGVKGRNQSEILTVIEADIDNVRLAWRHAVSDKDAQALKRSSECLFVYYLYRNGFVEGIRTFGRAASSYFEIPQVERADRTWLSISGVAEDEVELAGYLLACLGYFVAHRRDLRRGQWLLESARALLSQQPAGDRRSEAFAALWLGWAHHFQGQLREGRRCARECLRLLTDRADQWGAAWAILLLANCLRDVRPAEAEAEYQKGLILCRQTGDQIVLSYLHANIAVTLVALGRYSLAQEHVDTGVEIAERLGNFVGLGYTLLRRGQLEIARGEYPRAVMSLEQAWSYFEKVGMVHASRAQLYLAQVSQLQEQNDRAERFYRKALQGFEMANNLLESTYCLNGLGCLAVDQGNLDQAEQLQQKSIALLQEIEPDSIRFAATLRYLAQVTVASGDSRHAEARVHLRRALELAIKQQAAPLILDICLDVAQYLARRNETKRAIALLTVVEHHEATTFDTRLRARKSLISLRERMPQDQMHALQGRAPVVDLWRVAQAVMADLVADS